MWTYHFSSSHALIFIISVIVLGSSYIPFSDLHFSRLKGPNFFDFSPTIPFILTVCYTSFSLHQISWTGNYNNVLWCKHLHRLWWNERLPQNFHNLLYFHIFLLFGTVNVPSCIRLQIYRKVSTSRHATISCESWSMITACTSNLHKTVLDTLEKVKRSISTALS